MKNTSLSFELIFFRVALYGMPLLLIAFYSGCSTEEQKGVHAAAVDLRNSRAVKFVKIQETRYEHEGYQVVRWFDFESGLKFRNQDEESDSYCIAYNATVKKHLDTLEELEKLRLSDQAALDALSNNATIEEFPVKLSTNLLLDTRGKTASLFNGKGDELLVFGGDNSPPNAKVIRPEDIDVVVVQLCNSFFFISLDGRLLLQMEPSE